MLLGLNRVGLWVGGAVHKYIGYLDFHALSTSLAFFQGSGDL